MFLVLPLVLAFIALSQKTKNRKLNKKVVNNWSRILCFVCGLKLTTKGEIHNNPVFLVANHVTWLDIPVIHSYKLAGFVAKAEIAQWPILGWIVKSGETLFITRGKHESRKRVLSLIKDRLKQGRSIAVFPEGKVTDGSHVAQFHRQLMHAAIETQTPIQAIAIKYIRADDGKRNDKVCFLGKESFIKNVFRILSLRSSMVELTFCEAIKTSKLSAREIALFSHNQVAQVLAENDYM
jgi:1-acyl-sn-glycerol-3-phosphate acyltransferase